MALSAQITASSFFQKLGAEAATAKPKYWAPLMSPQGRVSRNDPRLKDPSTFIPGFDVPREFSPRALGTLSELVWGRPSYSPGRKPTAIPASPATKPITPLPQLPAAKPVAPVKPAVPKTTPATPAAIPATPAKTNTTTPAAPSWQQQPAGSENTLGNAAWGLGNMLSLGAAPVGGLPAVASRVPGFTAAASRIPRFVRGPARVMLTPGVDDLAYEAGSPIHQRIQQATGADPLALNILSTGLGAGLGAGFGGFRPAMLGGAMGYGSGLRSSQVPDDYQYDPARFAHEHALEDTARFRPWQTTKQLFSEWGRPVKAVVNDPQVIVDPTGTYTQRVTGSPMLTNALSQNPLGNMFRFGQQLRDYWRGQ